MSEWISVEEEMPDDGVWVIGYVDGDMAETVSWNERNEMFENGFEWIEKVTHWMPLPEPPK